jgi:D-3-phosphoglycerate dehydrogenase
MTLASSATRSSSAPASAPRSASSSRPACPRRRGVTLTEPRVLVKEKIADSGVELLREHFDVDLGVDWSRRRARRAHRRLRRDPDPLGDEADADLIERADNLKVIGRAGVGVDNVDVPAATKRGIIVANAPQSNVVAAAEHTIALMLALARNIPQAHAR